MNGRRQRPGPGSPRLNGYEESSRGKAGHRRQDGLIGRNTPPPPGTMSLPMLLAPPHELAIPHNRRRRLPRRESLRDPFRPLKPRHRDRGLAGMFAHVAAEGYVFRRLFATTRNRL